ncbi:hypothetical protein PMAYCL1PPCAC_10530 [Pristionchus mayeri]|uniref:Uncharacterized protein n=1 Tax=Pristionchus mayeri TaxID=1317129 RepID=A0AAN4ZNP5_9BILA|nr:hypothetical protein PMAYCL1PPCAC_10530 [Pristionchus mayeri]
MSIDQVSFICGDDAIRGLNTARDMLSEIRPKVHGSYKVFIPELEEIMAVGERTLVLCSPPVAA